MNSLVDEAEHSLLGNSQKAGGNRRFRCTRLIIKPRLLVKLFVAVLVAVIYAVIVIVIYEVVNTPWFGSNLFNGTYACHDSVTCGLRLNPEMKTTNHSITNQNVTSNYVFFSSLYSENYLPGALTLGYTIKKHHPNHKMYIIYFPEKISEAALCQLRAIGWIPRVVERLEAPWEGVSKTFIDQFTKLQMWSYAEFDGIAYIDSDALVVHPLDNAFQLIKDAAITGFEFAAAPDIMDGKFTVNFNAGVMLFRPHQTVYDEIMRTHKIRGGYKINFAEQAFLNEYYRFRLLYLPTTFNFNLSILRMHPHLWKVLFDEIKIVHYTSMKPFLRLSPTKPFVGPYEFWHHENDEMYRVHNFASVEASCSAQ